MKFVFKFILTTLFIPLFLLFLAGITVRFQFLEASFWENAFSTNDTYSKLSVSVSRSLESKTIAEGGKSSDIKILTDLISPENLKDVIDKNIINILQYADGRADEFNVYVPVSKIPKSLLSKSFDKVTEQMSLVALLKEFNVSGVSVAQIQTISHIGFGSWVFLTIATLLLFLLLYLLFLCTNRGKRLIAPGLALIISGISVLLVTALGIIIQISWTKDLVGSSNLGDSLIGAVVPPIIQDVLRMWLSFAVVAIILGVALLFLIRPVYNRRK